MKGRPRGRPFVASRGGAVGRSLCAMENRPAPDPAKLLSAWMEWETGETPPGRVMSNLKTGGLAELLRQLVEARDDVASGRG